MKPFYSHLFFDLDGTLTNPQEGITRSVEYALNAFGIQVENRDSLCCFIGPPLVESFQTYYHFTPEQAQQGLVKYRERFSTTGIWENKAYPGMGQMLAALKEAGKVLAVATSKPTVFAHQILERFGYLEYFDFVSGSELDGAHNQKHQVIAAALDYFKIQPSNVLMIGDTRFDAEGASRCGVDCVGVLYGFGTRKELEDAGAIQIADTVPSLQKLLLSH